MKAQFNIPNKVHPDQIEEVADHILDYWQKNFNRYDLDFHLEPVRALMPCYALSFYRFGWNLAICQTEKPEGWLNRLLKRNDEGQRDDLLVVHVSPQLWELAVTVEITNVGRAYGFLVVEWFIFLLRELAVTYPEIQAEIDRCLLEIEREYSIPNYILPPKGGGREDER